LPQKASEVDTDAPFTPEELLYRRVHRDKVNSKGEVDPSQINVTSFKRDIRSAPSVMRSRFCVPADVLHIDCAERETSDWLVFFTRVDSLPAGIVSGDQRSFDFYPAHIPLEHCGAHSVVASCITGDVERTYVKPSGAVASDFRVKFANSLKPVPAEDSSKS
jgi:hypothetical protein